MDVMKLLTKVTYTLPSCGAIVAMLLFASLMRESTWETEELNVELATVCDTVFKWSLLSTSSATRRRFP